MMLIPNQPTEQGLTQEQLIILELADKIDELTKQLNEERAPDWAKKQKSMLECPHGKTAPCEICMNVE